MMQGNGKRSAPTPVGDQLASVLPKQDKDYEKKGWGSSYGMSYRLGEAAKHARRDVVAKITKEMRKEGRSKEAKKGIFDKKYASTGGKRPKVGKQRPKSKSEVSSFTKKTDKERQRRIRAARAIKQARKTLHPGDMRPPGPFYANRNKKSGVNRGYGGAGEKIKFSERKRKK